MTGSLQTMESRSCSLTLSLLVSLCGAFALGSHWQCYRTRQVIEHAARHGILHVVRLDSYSELCRFQMPVGVTFICCGCVALWNLWGPRTSAEIRSLLTPRGRGSSNALAKDTLVSTLVSEPSKENMVLDEPVREAALGTAALPRVLAFSDVPELIETSRGEGSITESSSEPEMYAMDDDTEMHVTRTRTSSMEMRYEALSSFDGESRPFTMRPGAQSSEKLVEHGSSCADWHRNLRPILIH